jgi:hypothetical protein
MSAPTPIQQHIAALYRAAESAGLLSQCVWQRPSDQGITPPPEAHTVGFRAPEESVLDGLSLSTEYTMTYPDTFFIDLATQAIVAVDGQSFQVRQVRNSGDGEKVATLIRI